MRGSNIWIRFWRYLYDVVARNEVDREIMDSGMDGNTGDNDEINNTNKIHVID